jgi:hypothetical protein
MKSHHSSTVQQHCLFLTAQEVLLMMGLAGRPARTRSATSLGDTGPAPNSKDTHKVREVERQRKT